MGGNQKMLKTEKAQIEYYKKLEAILNDLAKKQQKTLINLYKK